MLKTGKVVKRFASLHVFCTIQQVQILLLLYFSPQQVESTPPFVYSSHDVGEQ